MEEQELTTATATFEDLLDFISNEGYTIKFGRTDLSSDFRDIPYIELKKKIISVIEPCAVITLENLWNVL